MAFQANLTARSQSHNFNSQSPTTLQITGGERIHEAISSRFIWQLLNNSSPNIRKNSFLMNAKENFIERKKKRNGKRTTRKTRTKGRRRRRRKNRALSRVFCLFGAKSIHTSTFQKQNIKKNSHHILYICIFFYFTLKIDYNAISLDHYIHLVSRTLTYR